MNSSSIKEIQNSQQLVDLPDDVMYENILECTTINRTEHNHFTEEGGFTNKIEAYDHISSKLKGNFYPVT